MNLSSIGSSVSLVLGIIDANKPTKPAIETTPQKPLLRARESSDPLPRVTPEEAGISSRLISDFLREIKDDPTLNMHDITILRNGKIVSRACFGAQLPDMPKMTFSACKSITSLAIGMLIDDGKLSLDDKVVNLLPQKVGTVSKLKLSSLTVGMLLAMRSGIIFNETEAMTKTDRRKAFFNSALMFEPGKSFNYNSLNTYILSAIVCEISGMSLSEFLKVRLFDPLGITNIFWEKCPEGIEHGGWGLYICAEDLAKIGLLVQNEGVWKGRRLISREYIKEATSVWSKAPEDYGEFDYGYQIWVGRHTDSFLFNGMLGQNVLCLKKSGIMIVSHAGNEEFFQQSAYFAYVKKYFDRDFPDTIKKDRRANAALNKLTRELCAFPVKRRLFSPAIPVECAKICGKTFAPASENAASTGLLPVILQGVQNNYAKGFLDISFTMRDGKMFMRYRETDADNEFELDFRRYVYTSMSFSGEPYSVAVGARFGQNEDGVPVLTVRLDFLETPCSKTVKLYLGRKPYLSQYEEPGEGFIIQKVCDLLDDMKKRPVIGAPLSHIDRDYIVLKTSKVFSPRLELEEK